MKRTVLTIAVVLALVVAGCSGGQTGADSLDDRTDTTLESTVEDSTYGAGAASVGTVSLYVSDERNAIGDFDHLNVTITRVGFKPVNESLATDGTETAGETTAETASGDENDTVEQHDTEPDAQGDTDRERAGWLEHEVDDRTFDLTTLQGPNASLLGDLDVPAGEYQQVFVSVSEVNGTLTSGEQVRVKLPSETLHLNEGFTVATNDSVDFVFDITVFGAGNSGKYILKPVVSESGPDKEIRNVDEKRDREHGQERARDQLEAQFVDAVEPGTNATIAVTRNGSGLANATVTLDDQQLGTTNATGMVTVDIPTNATELVLQVTAGDGEAELTWEAAETDDSEAETTESGSEDEPGPPEDPGQGNDK